MEKESLYGKTLDELKGVAVSLGMPAFTSLQLAGWLYGKGVSGIDEMTNISKVNREKLAARYETGRIMPVKVQESVDGTKKYLYPAKPGKFIETAYIPETSRSTLCVSSQVGCKMGCLFCMTGKQGFQGNLTAGEIVNQIGSLPEREKLTNIVYMGMGEPLDNTSEVLKSLEILTSEWGFAMSPRRITVSTIGILPGLKQFLDNSSCHLAISLHTPFDDERRKLMPVQTVYPAAEVLDFVKRYDWSGQRRVSVEYIMFDGVNDTERHIRNWSVFSAASGAG